MDLSHKRFLVTGGAGFLGRVVVQKLIERGVSASSIFIPRSSFLDLTKWNDCVTAVGDCEVVIHLAAVVGGIGANREHPGDFFYKNLVMGTQLMEAARLAGVEKFVTVGSVCAYPRLTPVPFREEDLWNGYPEETNAPYGIAKKALLVQAQAYRAEYGFNAIYLLPVNLYGPGDNFDQRTSHVIPALIRRIEEAQSSGAKHIECWGTGTPTREFLYVDDAAEAIVAATERYDKPEPVNLGTGRDISIADLAALIAKLMGYSGELRWKQALPDGQPRRRLDVSRAVSEFGFRASTSLAHGLSKTIEWYRQYRSESTI